MTISSIQRIALSGLLHAGDRLRQSAHDVANAATDGYQPATVRGREVAGGGVASTLVPSETAGVTVTIGGEQVTLSGTDLEHEVAVQIEAVRSFEANLAVLEAADEQLAALLDIVG